MGEDKKSINNEEVFAFEQNRWKRICEFIENGGQDYEKSRAARIQTVFK